MAEDREVSKCYSAPFATLLQPPLLLVRFFPGFCHLVDKREKKVQNLYCCWGNWADREAMLKLGADILVTIWAQSDLLLRVHIFSSLEQWRLRGSISELSTRGVHPLLPLKTSYQCGVGD
jgi:hypothetical protein